MLIIGIILGFVGLGYLCWLIFALAVYALPLFAGLTAGLAAYRSGSGPIAAITVAAIVSVIVLFAGQIAFRTFRSTPVRAAIALVFAVPAAVAGYHAADGLAPLVVPIEGWREAMAIAGAVMVATIAWARITVSAPNDPSRALLPA
jgi:hypothetical protein